MNCPLCNVELKMAERQNVEIDYCPQCRGVWLDRGELDKIIEQSKSYYSYEDHDKSQHYESKEYDKHHDDHKYHDYGHGGYANGHKKHKKHSLLESIFDFD